MSERVRLGGGKGANLSVKGGVCGVFCVGKLG